MPRCRVARDHGVTQCEGIGVVVQEPVALVALEVRDGAIERDPVGRRTLPGRPYPSVMHHEQ